ncbi:Steroid C26-monooxygenase [BD1-7 clade bacterium]|uniref:Steroid C26-monooxygenase n=1 Tax=BD1-7 clade bacterium TaxID=2029982 RepID=A0A5S9QWS0_9GAMM|nr:Steroid C26-monooxygenase [BD1-7 clade bacterium]
MADNLFKAVQARLLRWATQRISLVFQLLRIFKPVIVVGGRAIVTRFDDVQAVLNRPDEFDVTYAERMGVITEGDNFFLGMSDTARYQQDVSNMRVVARRTDIETRVRPFIATTANNLLDAQSGEIDLIGDYARRIPALWVGDYFGIHGPDENALIDWTTYMFQYLFFDDSPENDNQKAVAYAAECRPYLDQLIADRHQQADRDDIIGRCLHLQRSATPGMSDVAIRNNMLGLIVGAIPTLTKSFAHVLDYLLAHPTAMAEARGLSNQGDIDTLQRLVMECLRLNPFAAGVQRDVVADCTLSGTRLTAGTRVVVATQSAMLDGRRVEDPKAFRLDRPDWVYLHFGAGMHSCFGRYINPVILAMMLAPVVGLPDLRRANGEGGKTRWREAFPTQLKVVFTPEPSKSTAANTTDTYGQHEQTPSTAVAKSDTEETVV